MTQAITAQSKQIDQYYSERFLQPALPQGNKVVSVQDISDLAFLPDASVNCVVLDRTLNKTIEYMELMHQAYRVMKSGGTLLMTVGALSVHPTEKAWYWGFTEAAGRYIVGRFFVPEHITATTYGNVLAGRYLLEGRPAEELTARELAYSDKRLPILTGIRAEKH